MLVVLTVNLYTSRVVLAALGVEDFGIYNIVAGVAIMFDFLNTTMSSATSRFLTVELGIGNKEKLKRTFQTALLLHLIIAAIIVLICETVGLWLLNTKLIIAPERMVAANYVFQLAVLAIVFKVIQVPFMASVISNERMEVYAIVEILRVVLVLGCVILIAGCEYDRLIIYAAILAIIAFIICLLYVVYSKWKFDESSLSPKPQKELIKELVVYSGWDLYGNMCVTGRTQGLNITLNLFFGPLLNAANGIAMQVNTAVMQLSTNVISAFRPQIIKLYAKNEMQKMSILVNGSTKLSLVLFSLAAVPLIIEMPYVLDMWLKNPPEYSVSFSRMAIIAGILNVIINISNIPIHARGDIKFLSFINGTIFLLTVPAAYIVLVFKHNAEYAYFMIVIFTVICFLTSLYLLRRQIKAISIRSFLFRSILPSFTCILISAIISFLVHTTMGYGFMRLMTVAIVNAGVLSALAILVLLPKTTLQSIKNKIWKH